MSLVRNRAFTLLAGAIAASMFPLAPAWAQSEAEPTEQPSIAETIGADDGSEDDDENFVVLAEGDLPEIGIPGPFSIIESSDGLARRHSVGDIRAQGDRMCLEAGEQATLSLDGGEMPIIGPACYNVGAPPEPPSVLEIPAAGVLGVALDSSPATVVMAGSPSAIARYPRGERIDTNDVCLEEGERLVVRNARRGRNVQVRGPGCGRDLFPPEPARGVSERIVAGSAIGSGMLGMVIGRGSSPRTAPRRYIVARGSASALERYRRGLRVTSRTRICLRSGEFITLRSVTGRGGRTYFGDIGDGCNQRRRRGDEDNAPLVTTGHSNPKEVQRWEGLLGSAALARSFNLASLFGGSKDKAGKRRPRRPASRGPTVRVTRGTPKALERYPAGSSFSAKARVCLPDGAQLTVIGVRGKPRVTYRGPGCNRVVGVKRGGNAAAAKMG